MKLFFLTFFTVVGFLSVTIIDHSAFAAPSYPVVVELFTSQSCSSCPPADKRLGVLAEDDNIIALSCHVTYWDHLHWKDTLSQEFCTKRQYQYNQAIGKRGVFTPQMIVNGQHSAVGSRGHTVNAALKDAARQPIQALDLVFDGSALHVSLPDDIDRNGVDVYVLGYKDGHEQKIKFGENRGRTVHYTNPIVSYDILSGDRFLVTDREASFYAVLVQDSRSRQIVAAGKIDR